MTNTQRTHALAFATALLTTTMLTGCDIADTHQGADGGKAWATTCPDNNKKVAAYVSPDVSGTYGTTDVSGDFEKALRDRASRVAMCSGHLRVTAFSGSSTGTALLFDASIPLKGSTTNSRSRRLSSAVDKAVATVEGGFPLQLDQMAGGSDIVGQFRAIEEYGEQLGNEYVIDAVLLTDGLDNKTLPTHVITSPETAAKAAASVAVPDLSGAWLTISGLGNVAGAPQDSQTAESLVAFYSALCEKTNAARCTIVTDYVSPVGGGSV